MAKPSKPTQRTGSAQTHPSVSAGGRCDSVALSQHSIGEAVADPQQWVIADVKTFPRKAVEVSVCSKVSKILINSDLPEPAKQQGIYLLSLLPEDGTTRLLHSKVLGRMLPYKSQIYKLLIPHSVSRGKSYSAGRESKKWSYTKKPTTFTRYQITNVNLLDKLTSWKADKQKNDLEAQRENCVGTEWMVKSLERVSASFVAEELLAKKGLVMPALKCSISPVSGRISHSYTQLPAKVRLNLLLDCGDVVDVDMAKSQVAIISKLWMKSEEEKMKLRQRILDGTIYSGLEFAMEQDRGNIGRWNRSHPDDKITTTKQLFNKAIMGFQGSDWHSFRHVESDFPVMMRSIAAYKQKVTRHHGLKEALSRFAIKLQTEEALILAKVAEKCEPLDIPCVPIFDGMLVPISEAETVKGFFTETLLERLDFAPEPTIETAGYDVYPDFCLNL